MTCVRLLRNADMTRKQSRASAAEVEHYSTMRVTRARAKGLVSSNGVPPISESGCNQGERKAHRVSLKRDAVEEIKPKVGVANDQNKRRAVFKDVSNLLCNNAIAEKQEVEMLKPKRKTPLKKIAKNRPPTTINIPQLPVEKTPTKKTSENSHIITLGKSSADQKLRGSIELCVPNLTKSCISKSAASINCSSDHSEVCDDVETSKKLTFVDIDSKKKDPQWCSMYAVEIYNHLRTMELQCRPSDSYMETIQRDITQGMRAMLIDWLVEVSEEYKLVPDTLYLTVNLIDRYLSLSCIERNKLQLLGVTCMLIASKFEEICAPHVEEFCYVTDNTYSKQQVLEMETRVLNLLCFRLTVPTTKSFLRRFVRAAQACDEDHAVELELLANYLSELALMEYNFVNLLPSMVAASAVFLARWTIKQSDNPWNPTLEFHTNYKALELKATIIEMQSLQLNIDACPLNAIREKYKLVKFKSVATLIPAKPVQSLF